MIKKLIKVGANLNLQDCMGKTALIVAVSKNYINLVAFFVEAGAAVQLKDNKGNTALDIEILANNNQIVNILNNSKNRI